MGAWPVVDYVDGWVDGWTRSRETVRPEAVDGGWYVATGTDLEVQGYVLSEPTPPRLEAVLGQGQTPTTCGKRPAEPDDGQPRFGGGWEPTHEDRFMTPALRPPPGRRPPARYEIKVEPAPTFVIASVLAPEGNVVASGRMGLGASYAVADQIVTDDRHRRLGLGTVVMAELERHALEA